MESFIQKLVDNCIEVFDDDILCILLLGSVQKGDTTPFSDIDLVAVVKSFNIIQMREIRQRLRQSEKLTDFSFICWNEVPKDPNLFLMGTHGCYQLGLILNKADCLYGRNVLLDLGKPTDRNIKLSLFNKIAQYTWWARRMFVESNRERSLESNYQLNSRLIKMIRGILYLSDGFDIHESVEKTIRYFLDKYTSILSAEEQLIIVDIGNKFNISENTANMSDYYLEIRFSVINKIHKEANKLIHSL